MTAQASLLDISPLHDPGGKVRIPVPASWQCEAVFSPCERYRYQLSRIWRPGPNPQLVLFVMMNPSTADAKVNDPTIAKCCRLARAWGYDGLLIGNVCAYRATDKRNLPATGHQAADRADALGPENHIHLLLMAARAKLIVMAHGQLPEKLRCLATTMRLFLRMYDFKLHVLRLAKDGTPYHPLYLREDLRPVLWDGE